MTRTFSRWPRPWQSSGFSSRRSTEALSQLWRQRRQYDGHCALLVRPRLAPSLERVGYLIKNSLVCLPQFYVIQRIGPRSQGLKPQLLALISFECIDSIGIEGLVID